MGVPGKVGWGLEQAWIVKVAPDHGREWNWMEFNVPSNPNPSGIKVKCIGNSNNEKEKVREE